MAVKGVEKYRQLNGEEILTRFKTPRSFIFMIPL